MLDNSRRKADHEQDAMLKLNKDVIITLFDAAQYLAKQGSAFRRDPHSEGLPGEHECFSLKDCILIPQLHFKSRCLLQSFIFYVILYN
ncbi:unnamed protein product [Didymodactylos carnosus]|nr:unnamed protein product [Didymodactylos carnosus]CAF3884056.1 unnamed protein product [Didymodactylos carnosus]